MRVVTCNLWQLARDDGATEKNIIIIKKTPCSLGCTAGVVTGKRACESLIHFVQHDVYGHKNKDIVGVKTHIIKKRSFIVRSPKTYS